MSRKKTIDLDTLLGEMGAVAAFAKCGTTEPEVADGQDEQESLLSTLVPTPEPTLARERRTIADGRYEVTIGWEAEPAIAGQKNAAAFSILRAGGLQAEPVEGLEQTLAVRLRQGTDTVEFPARRVLGHPGQYAAHFIPTRPGSYTFMLLGTIEGQPVEESFDCASGYFADVEPAASVQFPAAAEEPSRAVTPAPEADAARRVTRAVTLAGFSLGFVGALALWRAWGNRAPYVDAALGGAASREAPQAPGDPWSDDEGLTMDLGQSVGPAVQEEIALTLQPLAAEFRQHVVQAVREQTAQAFQASGWKAA